MIGQEEKQATNYETIQIGKAVYKKAEFGPKAYAEVSKEQPGQFSKVLHTTIMRKTEGKRIIA